MMGMPSRHWAGVVIVGLPALGWVVPMYLELPERYPAFESLLVPKLVGFLILSGVGAVATLFAGVLTKESLRGKATFALALAACNALAVSMWVDYLNGALAPGKVRARAGSVAEIPNPARRAPRHRLEVQDGEHTLATPFHAGRYFWSVGNVRSGGPVVVKLGDGLFGATYVESLADPPPDPSGS